MTQRCKPTARVDYVCGNRVRPWLTPLPQVSMHFEKTYRAPLNVFFLLASLPPSFLRYVSKMAGHTISRIAHECQNTTPPASEFQKRVFHKVYNGKREPLRVVVVDARERNQMHLHAAAEQKERFTSPRACP